MRTASLRWVRPFAMVCGAAALLYLGGAVWAGAEATWHAMAQVPGWLVIAATLLASTAYLARWSRWRWMMFSLGHRLPAWFELRAYVAGLALTSTPGKLGETVRSVLLLEKGVPVAQSLAAFFSDRLSDVLAVALLGLLAARLSGNSLPSLEWLALAVAAGALVAQQALRTARWRLARQQLAQRRTGSAWLRRSIAAVLLLSAPAQVWQGLWTLRRWPGYVLIAMLAYGAQSLVLWLYAQQMGLALGPLQCLAMFASATLLGAASLVPAGLGVFEAALVYQLGEAGVAWQTAVALAVLTRLSTLWCGLLLGSLALGSLGGVRAVPSTATTPVALHRS